MLVYKFVSAFNPETEKQPVAFKRKPTEVVKSLETPFTAKFNNNNELYLHGHKRDLQHCKSILTITKSKSNNNIKLSIINCLAFPNRMLHIVLTAC